MPKEKFKLSKIIIGQLFEVFFLIYMSKKICFNGQFGQKLLTDHTGNKLEYIFFVGYLRMKYGIQIYVQ